MNLTDKEKSLICNIGTKLGVDLDGDLFKVVISECCDHLIFEYILQTTSDDQLKLTDSEKEVIRSIIAKYPTNNIGFYVHVHNFVVKIYNEGDKL